jgi:hypothetical protein
VLYAPLGLTSLAAFPPSLLLHQTSLSLRQGAVAGRTRRRVFERNNYATLRSHCQDCVTDNSCCFIKAPSGEGNFFCSLARWLSVTVISSGNRLNAFFSSITVNMQSLSGTLPRQHPVVSMSGLSLIPQPSYIGGPSTMMGHPTLRRQSSHDMDHNMPRILSRNAANVQYYYG